jgi:hypothetical protein
MLLGIWAGNIPVKIRLRVIHNVIYRIPNAVRSFFSDLFMKAALTKCKNYYIEQEKFICQQDKNFQHRATGSTLELFVGMWKKAVHTLM